MTNAQVAQAWARGIPARTQNMSTDGLTLYSYRLAIGQTDPETGRKTIFQYTANGEHGFRSMTTSHHVTLANRYAR